MNHRGIVGISLAASNSFSGDIAPIHPGNPTETGPKPAIIGNNAVQGDIPGIFRERGRDLLKCIGDAHEHRLHEDASAQQIREGPVVVPSSHAQAAPHPVECDERRKHEIQRLGDATRIRRKRGLWNTVLIANQGGIGIEGQKPKSLAMQNREIGLFPHGGHVSASRRSGKGLGSGTYSDPSGISVFPIRKKMRK